MLVTVVMKSEHKSSEPQCRYFLSGMSVLGDAKTSLTLEVSEQIARSVKVFLR